MTTATLEKIEEVKIALRQLGYNTIKPPEWTRRFSTDATGAVKGSFLDWLQFVFLPNCVANRSQQMPLRIAPQAALFIGKDEKEIKLLQLLVELDSLI